MKIAAICLFFVGLSVVAYCGQSSRIELTDGSVVNGEIVSYLNGVYTVDTGSLGQVSVPASKVSLIKTANAPVDLSGQPATFSSSNVENFRQKLMSNPDNAAVVSNLTSNPKIQEMAKDPQIEAAVKSGNMQALISNPKFMEMVNSPEMQEGIKKLKKE